MDGPLRVLLRRDDGVADEEEEELDEPRDEVARPGDDVLVHPVLAHVAPPCIGWATG